MPLIIQSFEQILRWNTGHLNGQESSLEFRGQTNSVTIYLLCGCPILAFVQDFVGLCSKVNGYRTFRLLHYTTTKATTCKMLNRLFTIGTKEYSLEHDVSVRVDGVKIPTESKTCTPSFRIRLQHLAIDRLVVDYAGSIYKMKMKKLQPYGDPQQTFSISPRVDRAYYPDRPGSYKHNKFLDIVVQ